jgi:hypothetical protein
LDVAVAVPDGVAPAAAVVGLTWVDVGVPFDVGGVTATGAVGSGDAEQLETASTGQTIIGTSHILAWPDVARLARLRLSIPAA